MGYIYWQETQGCVTIGNYESGLSGYNRRTKVSKNFDKEEDARKWLREQVLLNNKAK